MFRLLLTCLLALAATVTVASEPIWPGGIAWFDLGPATGEAPVVEFDGNRVLVVNDDKSKDGSAIVMLNGASGTISNCNFVNCQTDPDFGDFHYNSIFGTNI